MNDRFVLKHHFDHRNNMSLCEPECGAAWGLEGWASFQGP